MKKCPHCAEFVATEAITCWRCHGRLIDPHYEYKTFHTDHVYTFWWCIPDDLPSDQRPTEADVRRVCWQDNGEDDVRAQLAPDFAQGWLADYIGPELLLLTEKHESSTALPAGHESYTTYDVGFECELKRPRKG